MTKLGILGDGQLAQLLGHSAYGLNVDTFCFTDSDNKPGARFNHVFKGNLQDRDALKQFAEYCDVITFESEKVDPHLLSILNNLNSAAIRPNSHAIVTCQDRIKEKNLLNQLSIPTAHYAPIYTFEDLQHYAGQMTSNAILKVAIFGYDGKGQFELEHYSDLNKLWRQTKNQPLILEEKVDFDCEVSLLAARDINGQCVYYPLIYNHHQQGVLVQSNIPSRYTQLQKQAEQYAYKLMSELDYIGLMAIEFFVRDETLLVNEIAPRVHNSGHATIEAMNCSQFENHSRAVMGLPLIEPELLQYALMFNILGDEPQWRTWPSIPTLRYYLYGKSPSPGRKLGHISITSDSPVTLEQYGTKLNVTYA